ncbi:histidine kinase N-terminal 7TM domain-containing diguanylate cyclase [Candidatus Contubernalis alkaliaceticus]|uniref:histidine kinase N-terminal 7TM domain-containing diguanylate cyclase n=1 Tax=Candidatus Contubernalis alkaliaceticus TaxID=338645 RepID=UPI001F4BFBB8|nr:histidine kinase N-terminal 7TM domain-containing protein [Candidatus Contubernalis alkalaceticus]UNC91327.1 diguanylate cyclase [Candidatus Contubernalis alkalaceticus]
MQTILPFFIMLVIAGAFTSALAVYVFKHRKVPGVFPFILLMVCASIWSLGYAMELYSLTFESKLFWLNVKVTGAILAPVFWLALVLEYSGRKSWVQGKRLFYWCVIPLLAILLIWTNEFHHLIRLDARLIEFNAITYIEITRTSLSWLFFSYGYMNIFLCLIILLDGLFSKGYYWQQFVILLISLLLPLGSDAANMMGFLYPFNITPLLFIPSGLLIAWGLYRYKLFDIQPIARDKVIDMMESGILVVNTDKQIVDYNIRAAQIIDNEQDEQGGSMSWYVVSEVLKKWPKWAAAYDCPEESSFEIKMSQKGGEQYYRVRTNPLLDSREVLVGYLSIIDDISDQKLKEQELTHLATSDSLTGIANRRYYLELSDKIFSAARRYNHKLSLLMLDLDNFKKINDTYGHRTGDLLLKKFVVVCHDIIRSSDVFGRIGGEEFAITLPETGLTEAFYAAKRIRQKVADVKLDIGRGEMISFTVSIGVAVKVPDDRCFEDILLRADNALYEAKIERNMVKIQGG